MIGFLSYDHSIWLKIQNGRQISFKMAAKSWKSHKNRTTWTTCMILVSNYMFWGSRNSIFYVKMVSMTNQLKNHYKKLWKTVEQDRKTKWICFLWGQTLWFVCKPKVVIMHYLNFFKQSNPNRNVVLYGYIIK